MVIDAQVVPYEARHREGIYALLGAGRFKRLMWDWQFCHLENRAPSPALVLEAKGRVLGFNGVMPVAVSLNGKRIDALWSCDFYLAPEFRSMGFGAAMKAMLKLQAPLIMAFNISDRAALVLERSGWRPVNGVVSARRLRQAQGKRIALLGIQYLNQLRRLSWRVAGETLSVALGPLLPAPMELDALWQRVATGYSCAVVRDSAYLHWRYVACPCGSYRFVVARDREGLLRGLAVVRESSGSLLLVDLVAAADDADVRRALVGEVLVRFADCESFSCTTSDLMLLRVMEAFGFYVSRERPRFYVWGNEHLAERPYQPWFVMGGDSDGEMLMAASDAWGESS